MSEIKEKVRRAKAYLLRLVQCDARINAMQEKKEDLFAQATRITPVLKHDVVSGGGNHDKIGDAVARIADMEAEINRQIDFYVDMQEEANALLHKLESNVHYTILYRRYMLGDTWAMIADEIGKGERHTKSLHSDALLAFCDVLDMENGKTP